MSVEGRIRYPKRAPPNHGHPDPAAGEPPTREIPPPPTAILEDARRSLSSRALPGLPVYLVAWALLRYDAPPPLSAVEPSFWLGASSALLTLARSALVLGRGLAGTLEPGTWIWAFRLATVAITLSLGAEAALRVGVGVLGGGESLAAGIVVGMSAIGLYVYSADLALVVGTVLSMNAPVLVGLLWSSGPATGMLIVADLILVTYCLVLGRRLHKELGDRFRSTRLLEMERQRLSTAVAELQVANQETLAAKEEAERAGRAKAGFLATMSHEIRTPMNAIIGMTGLLLETPLTATQREFVETIRTGGDSLLVLVNDILDFSRIESGRLDLEPLTFCVFECLESALDLVAPQAAAKGLHLGYHLDAEVPELVLADGTRVRQVLVNLLSNAVKFTERGSVHAEVRTAVGRGGLTFLRFSVADTGAGIPESSRTRLFEPFVQVGHGVRARKGGSGLGLAISRRLVDAMGGRIWVESGEGHGSTFRFTVPVAPATSGATSSGMHQIAFPSGMRLRLAGASPGEEAFLGPLLRRWGFELTARELRDGIEPDIVVIGSEIPDEELGAVAPQCKGAAPAAVVLLRSLGWKAPASVPATAAVVALPLKRRSVHSAIASALGLNASRSSSDSGRRVPLPISVLVAEDNAVNQRVALQMLSHFGLVADSVSNGLEVLAAFERRRYDVVLMDVQMPELDGIEATRRLRALPDGGRPWIVAMTAGALEGDREECLAAGMDGYLAKPVTLEALGRTIRRVGRRGLPPGAGRAEPRGAPEPEIDGEALARLREIQTASSPSFVAEIVTRFTEEAPAQIAALRSALRSGDLDDARRTAHRLKGSCRALGANGMAARCQRLEELASRRELEAAAAEAERLGADYPGVRSALLEAALT